MPKKIKKKLTMRYKSITILISRKIPTFPTKPKRRANYAKRQRQIFIRRL